MLLGMTNFLGSISKVTGICPCSPCPSTCQLMSCTYQFHPAAFFWSLSSWGPLKFLFAKSCAHLKEWPGQPWDWGWDSGWISGDYFIHVFLNIIYDIDETGVILKARKNTGQQYGISIFEKSEIPTKPISLNGYHLTLSRTGEEWRNRVKEHSSISWYMII